MGFGDAVTMKMVEEIVGKFKEVVFESMKIPKLVETTPKPRKFLYTKIQRAEVAGATPPDQDEPSIEIENPLDEECVIKEIAVIPDSDFKTNGRLKVFVDDAKVFEDEAVADWTDVSELKIPLENGKQIKQKRSVKFLIWGSAGFLTVFVTFAK